MLPVIFFWHWSPMNTLENIELKDILNSLWNDIRSRHKDFSIVVISAHRLTGWGALVTADEHPEIIHDFSWFPQELYEIKYPAKWNPELANKLASEFSEISPAYDRGLDHWAWAWLIDLFPGAEFPVIQVSIDMNLSLSQHFEFAQKLKKCRNENVLFICSWNVIHNFKQLSQGFAAGKDAKFDWAINANNFIKEKIESHNFESLLNIHSQAWMMHAIPDLDHYIPLIYACWLTTSSDIAKNFYNWFEYWVISLSSYLFK